MGAGSRRECGLDGVGQGFVLAGRYRLEERLQADSRGSQWRAVDQTLERQVVVRVLDATHPQAEDIVDAARRAALAEDPRLVRILDVGSQPVPGGHATYIVSEHVNGRTLAEAVAAAALPAETARRIVGEASQALARAGSRGLHHLRLDPYAVWITSDGSIKVSGTAIDASIAGTEPETSQAAERIDAVALVAVLYTALTGRWPGPASSRLRPAPRVHGRTTAPGDLVAGIPNDLDTLCSVTLGDHDDGPRSPAELADQLAPWARSAQLSDPRGLTLTGPDRPAPRAAPRPVQHPPVRPPARTGTSAPVAAAGRGDVRAADPAAAGAPAALATPPSVPPAVAPAGSPAHAAADPEQAATQVRRSADADPVASSGRSWRPGAADAATAAPTHGPHQTQQTQQTRATHANAAPASGPGAPATTGWQGRHAASGVEALGGPTGSGGAPGGAPGRADDDTSQFDAPFGAVGAAAGGGPWAGLGHAEEGEEYLGPFLPPAPLTRPPQDQSRLVLLIVAAVVVLGLLVALWSLRDFGGEDEAGGLVTTPGPTASAPQSTAPQSTAPQESPSPPASGTQPSATPSGPAPAIAGVRALDPLGDQEENDAIATRAIDGEPGTAWRSSRYKSQLFGGLKDGLGLAVQLEDTATVRQVLVASRGSDGVVELRVADGPDVEGSTVVATANVEGGKAVLTPATPVTSRYLLLWVTRLPEVDGEGQMFVSEIELR